MSGVLDSLKNRTRPKVARREDNLMRKTEPDVELSATLESPSDIVQKVEPDDTQTTESIIHSPQEYPSNLKRLGLRVDGPTVQNIEEMCLREKITPETFLEAAFVVYEANPSQRKRVIQEARKRYELRKEVGKRKRRKTIAEQYQREQL